MTVAADTNATFAHRHVFLEQAGLAAVYGVAGALQFSIAVAQILLTIAFVCWAALIAMDREPVEVPRFAWPLALYAAITLVSTVFSPDPRVEPHGRQADGAVPARAAGLPLRDRSPRVDDGHGDRVVRGRERHRRDRAVRRPSLRQPWAAGPGHARPLHDVLGPADARDRRRAVPRAVRQARSSVVGARDSGARRRRGVQLLAQRRGRRLRGGRPAAAAQGPPPPRPAADRRGALLPAGAHGDLRSLRVDLLAEESDEPGPHRHAARRRAHDQGSPVRRHRAEHGAAALRRIPRSGRRPAGQPAPPQRARADRRRARPAGARRVAVVHRQPGRRA